MKPVRGSDPILELAGTVHPRGETEREPGFEQALAAALQVPVVPRTTPPAPPAPIFTCDAPTLMPTGPVPVPAEPIGDPGTVDSVGRASRVPTGLPSFDEPPADWHRSSEFPSVKHRQLERDGQLERPHAPPLMTPHPDLPEQASLQSKGFAAPEAAGLQEPPHRQSEAARGRVTSSPRQSGPAHTLDDSSAPTQLIVEAPQEHAAREPISDPASILQAAYAVFVHAQSPAAVERDPSPTAPEVSRDSPTPPSPGAPAVHLTHRLPVRRLHPAGPDASGGEVSDGDGGSPALEDPSLRSRQGDDATPVRPVAAPTIERSTRTAESAEPRLPPAAVLTTERRRPPSDTGSDAARRDATQHAAPEPILPAAAEPRAAAAAARPVPAPEESARESRRSTAPDTAGLPEFARRALEPERAAPHPIDRLTAANVPSADPVIEAPASPAPLLRTDPVPAPAPLDRVVVHLPPEAGGARVQIAVRGDVVHARIVAPDERAGDALERGLNELRGALERHGFQDAKLQVEVAHVSDATGAAAPSALREPAAGGESRHQDQPPPDRRHRERPQDDPRPDPRDQQQRHRSPHHDRRERERN